MTSLSPPFNRRNSFRKQPFFYEPGRGVFTRQTGVVSPSLSLDFTTGTLDSRITFSRPSLATMYDSTGKLTYAPNNLLTYNTDPNSWTKSGVSSVVGQVVTFTGAGSFQQIANGGWGGTALVGQRFVFGVTLSGSGTITLDCNGASGSSTITLTGTPTWYSVVVTASATSSLSARIISYTGNTATSFTMHNAFFSAVTYETSQRVANFINTTSSAYYGPRFDYNPSTLATRGILIEEARTNLILQSQNFSSAAWSKDAGVTVSSDTDVAPDGTTTADTISSALGSTNNTYQTMTVTVGQTYTFSVYLKKTVGAVRYPAVQIYEASYSPAVVNTNTGTIASNGATQTATISDAGSYWRVTVTRTVAAATVYPLVIPSFNSDGSQTPSGGSGSVVAWGAQLELGSFATSYIPTGSSSVARSADVATMTGTNFSSWYNATEGTFKVSGDTPAIGTRTLWAIDDNTAAEQQKAYSFGTDTEYLVIDNSAPVVSIGGDDIVAGVASVYTSAYKLNDFAFVINSVNVRTENTGTIPTVTLMRIGSDQAGNYLDGHIQSIYYYNQRLTNSQMGTPVVPIPTLVIYDRFDSAVEDRAEQYIETRV